MHREMDDVLANPKSTRYKKIKGNKALKELARLLLKKDFPDENLKKLDRMTKAELLDKISSIQDRRMGMDAAEEEDEDADAEGEEGEDDAEEKEENAEGEDDAEEEDEDAESEEE
jgi:hypothetical protein